MRVVYGIIDKDKINQEGIIAWLYYAPIDFAYKMKNAEILTSGDSPNFDEVEPELVITQYHITSLYPAVCFVSVPFPHPCCFSLCEEALPSA